jgi:hypothetical protein
MNQINMSLNNSLKKSYTAQTAQPAHLYLIAAQRSTSQFLLRLKIKCCATATKSAAQFSQKYYLSAISARSGVKSSVVIIGH